jgi:hypothetical protein
MGPGCKRRPSAVSQLKFFFFLAKICSVGGKSFMKGKTGVRTSLFSSSSPSVKQWDARTASMVIELGFRRTLSFIEAFVLSRSNHLGMAA